jgi:hypothetical protein
MLWLVIDTNQTTATVYLTSIGNLVSGYGEFLVALIKTIVERVKKIRSPIWGMVWQCLLAKICFVVDYLRKKHFYLTECHFNFKLLK